MELEKELRMYKEQTTVVAKEEKLLECYREIKVMLLSN